MNFKWNRIGIVIMFALLVLQASVAVAGERAPDLKRVYLQKDTVIKVQAVETVNSIKNKQNETVQFKVKEDVLINDVLVIPAQTVVYGTITKVKKGSAWANPGQIEIAFSEVSTPAGNSVPVRGLLYKCGKKPNFFVQFSLLGVFVKGKEAVIEAGTEVELAVKEDTDFFIGGYC